MRARKRNPYLGQGLDKRQARRARRRGGSLSLATLVGQFIERHTEVELTDWQRAVVSAYYDRWALGQSHLVINHPRRR